MITLKDILSHLSFRDACKLLGPKGSQLIFLGGKFNIDIANDVSLTKNRFSLMIDGAVVMIRLSDDRDMKLDISCTSCTYACEHKGAALSLILEEKLSLGLSIPPTSKKPIEHMSDEELKQFAIESRALKSQKEKMEVSPTDENNLWSDYVVTSLASGKSYRVALRGLKRGESYCNCPDYSKNTLGTCKHIFKVIDYTKTVFDKEDFEKPYLPQDIHIYLQYGQALELRIAAPAGIPAKIQTILNPMLSKAIEDIPDLIKRVKAVEELGFPVITYPDAQAYIQAELTMTRIKKKMGYIRKNLDSHPLRTNLLKAELLPYQLDGIAFAVMAGRAIIADDMGLGKTIQGIGVAELLIQDFGIRKILIVCPASLKAQWRQEILKFSDRSVQLILGKTAERSELYDNDEFFTICNYEQVLRDFLSIEKVNWDLIILDEAQRIKNWEAKTSQIIKSLKSTFALVLTGTPIENRLDELYSIVEFIDNRRLGPAFAFFNQYRLADEHGKVIGYKNLDHLREKLKPVIIRRTRQMVLKQLPPRTTEYRRIPPTEEQKELDNHHRQLVTIILSKSYLTEMDFLRLQKALLMARMAADSTYLVTKEPPGYSSKIAELEILLQDLMNEASRKIVLFSEWTTMLDLVETVICKMPYKYVRLDGSVPQKKRQVLVNEFQTNPECRLFITTNAGSTGLNLQAANTVINVDLPWNPAILEQRIGRAHRMGQKQPVHVIIMVTEDTIEENLLNTLASKEALAFSVLDPNASASEIDLTSGLEALRNKLEELIGVKANAPIDKSQKSKIEAQTLELLGKYFITRPYRPVVSTMFKMANMIVPINALESKTTTFISRIYDKFVDIIDKERGKNRRIGLKRGMELAISLNPLKRFIPPKN